MYLFACLCSVLYLESVYLSVVASYDEMNPNVDHCNKNKTNSCKNNDNGSENCGG